MCHNQSLPNRTYADHTIKSEQMLTSGWQMEVDETAILGGRIRSFQPMRGYRTAIDAVLLAACVPAKRGQQVLDIGTGVGVSALCLVARVKGVRVTGLELQAPLAALAKRGIIANGYQDLVNVLTGNLLDPPTEVERQGFNHVMANPPYVEAGKGNLPKDHVKAVSTVEGRAKLEDWIRFAVFAKSRQGSITFIHRAERREQLVTGLEASGMGRMELLPLIPKAGLEPNRIIVRAWSGSSGEVSEAEALVLHEKNGAFTEAAESVLRGGKSLL